MKKIGTITHARINGTPSFIFNGIDGKQFQADSEIQIKFILKTKGFNRVVVPNQRYIPCVCGGRCCHREKDVMAE